MASSAPDTTKINHEERRRGSPVVVGDAVVGAVVGAVEGAGVGLEVGDGVGLAVCFTKYQSGVEGTPVTCAGVCSLRAYAGFRATPPPTSCAVHGPGTVREGQRW